jgi:hypothetical protein
MAHVAHGGIPTEYFWKDDNHSKTCNSSHQNQIIYDRRVEGEGERSTAVAVVIKAVTVAMLIMFVVVIIVIGGR